MQNSERQRNNRRSENLGVYYKAEITIIPSDKADVITASNFNDDGENDPFAVKNLGE